ncbi:hypothetical protein VTK56DRAFT_7668 [Thermocarpiscus australiensis]
MGRRKAPPDDDHAPEAILAGRHRPTTPSRRTPRPEEEPYRPTPRRPRPEEEEAANNRYRRATTPPPSPGRSQHRRLPVSHATDIVDTILKTDPSLQRASSYRAQFRARARFWQAFPGGAYVRLPTPGTDLECGFHALRQSMQHHHQQTIHCPVPVPRLEELRSVFRSRAMAQRNADAGMDNDNNFSADQLAAVFSEWGRRRHGLRCQLGYVSASDGMPVMMGTPYVETDEDGADIVRVWVYNTGSSLTGEMGHFEGIRRPTPDERCK